MTIQEELAIELTKYARNNPEIILEGWVQRKFDYSSDGCDAIAKMLGKRIILGILFDGSDIGYTILASVYHDQTLHSYFDTSQTEKLPAIQVALTKLLREENEKT